MDTPSQEGTPAQDTSAPSTTSAWGDSSTPDWIKATGLQEAHNAGSQAAGVTPPVETDDPARDPEDNVVPSTQRPAQPTRQPSPPATQQPAQAPAAQPSAQPAPAVVDAEQLVSRLAPLLRPQQAQPGPSDADLQRQLGIVTVTPERYKSVFGVDGTPDQIKGLNDFGQDVAKQAVTIASVLMRNELESIRSQFTPISATVQEQEAARQRDIFFTEHRDLAGYENFVRQQFQLVKASGQRFSSVADVRKAVADQTRSTLQSLGIKLPAAGSAPAHGRSNAPRSATPQPRTMAPTSMGGRGGVSGQPAAQTTNQAVWG